MMQNSCSLKSEINIFTALCNIYTKKRLFGASICKFWVKFRINIQFIYGENVAKVIGLVCRFYTLKSFSPNRVFSKKSAFASALKIKTLQNAVKMVKKCIFHKPTYTCVCGIGLYKASLFHHFHQVEKITFLKSKIL